MNVSLRTIQYQGFHLLTEAGVDGILVEDHKNDPLDMVRFYRFDSQRHQLVNHHFPRHAVEYSDLFQAQKQPTSLPVEAVTFCRRVMPDSTRPMSGMLFRILLAQMSETVKPIKCPVNQNMIEADFSEFPDQRFNVSLISIFIQHEVF